MPRIRTIKPEFQLSESMGRISRDARLTFILMWTLADDSGRLRGSPRLLAGTLFPYDNDAFPLIEGWIHELQMQKCIQCYEDENGHSYIEICNFDKHQKIDKRWDSRLPAPPSPIPPDSPRKVGESPRFVPLDLGPRTKDQGEDQGEDHFLMSTFVDVWNSKVKELSEEGYRYASVRRLTGKRKTKLRQRLKCNGWAEAAQDGIASLPINQFGDWVPDFDWLLANDENAFKLAEGNYHKKPFDRDDKNKLVVKDYFSGDDPVLRRMIKVDEQTKRDAQRIRSGGTVDANAVRRISEG